MFIPIIINVLVIAASCSGRPAGNAAFPLDVYSDERDAILGRGIVSYRGIRDQVYLSWRLLPEDPKGVAFNIYRKEIGDQKEKHKWIARTSQTSYSYADRDARDKHFV